MDRLSLVSGIADRELDGIRGTIQTFDSVFGFDDVVALLQRRSMGGDLATVLDAIGHSSSHGFLTLGSWVIDDSPQTAASFRQLLHPALQRMGVQTIRLLGCSTATNVRASNAMRRIAQVTGCDVLGTTRYVSRHDYGPSGFESESALIDAVSSRLRLAACASRLR